MTKRHRTDSAPRESLPVAAAAVVAVGRSALPPAAGSRGSPPGTQARACTRRRLEHQSHALRVAGTEANDAIALRLAGRQPRQSSRSIVGDNGSADFSFARASDRRHRRRAPRRRRPSCASTTRNGAFTDTIPTTIDGGRRQRHARRRRRRGAAARRLRQRHDRRQRRQRPGASGRRRRHRSSGIRATAATRSRARPAPTRCCSTAPTPPSTSTCRRTANRLQVLPRRRRTSRWTPHDVERSTSTHSAAPTRSPSTT